MTELANAEAGPRTIGGRYTLLEELGRGGSAVVWRGDDTLIGRQVAVKELLLSPALAERVLHEARTAGALNHPSVVTVHDVVVENGGSFIVMELVEAPTLEDLVSSGPLSAQVVADIGRQVLGALAVAHAAGIVHRDVKPANIMVRPDGQAKLTDFGIARTATDSPAYLAPERISGHEATPTADLWSLGAALLTASEGGNPFQRENTAATLYAVVNEAPRMSRTQGPLAEVIGGLLAKSPQARLIPDQAIPLLTFAASNAGALAESAPSTPWTAPARPASTPSVPAVLASVAAMLFGFLLLADAMMIHQAYFLFDILYPPLLLGRLSVVFGGVAALIGGVLLLARLRAGQITISVSAGLTLLTVLLLTLPDEEREYLGLPLQPGFALDLLALAFAAVLAAAVWLIPVRRAKR
ncbi:serine/threonine-protein kinase [Amycolatopsis sp. lyj-112]|uniref:serine/threonine-protein kinase n=1 Tax=Amycolatopsis sp. lyj-112 TaxID=2789288 RepID=UPI00397B3010